jgi:RNA polymerase sigma-70 factor (ECF subfamily)
MPASEADRQLIQRIRSGEALAWQQCIDQYEGRLLAYARAHLQDRSAAEDVVQETLLGFLKSAPELRRTNTARIVAVLDCRGSKLVDALRRSGRRPVLPLLTSESKDGAARDLTGPGRALPACFAAVSGRIRRLR